MPTAEVDGTSLHYLDVGSGDPPVVLVHAFPMQAAMWAPQLACFSATHRVVAPDLRGFGGSPIPADPSAATMAGYADDVAGLLRGLGIGRAVLGGLSMGGYVAFSFLRRHPEMVSALVLADTRAAADDSVVLARRTAQQDEVSREGTAGLVEALLAGLLGASTRAHRPELVAQVRALMAANPPAGFVGALEAMKGRPDATGDLSSIGVPTLVVVGDEDTLSPPDSVREWQRQIPGSRLAVLPGAGHLSNLEAPEAFNAVVADLLDGL